MALSVIVPEKELGKHKVAGIGASKKDEKVLKRVEKEILDLPPRLWFYVCDFYGAYGSEPDDDSVESRKRLCRENTNRWKAFRTRCYPLNAE
ncbi:hypothetical protein JCM33374_g2232 [Metschnikowia sp. JCM 33374]|nr:hypothetical protein JCM33374_g2232 [Metschnikowia sp. JCM 33374]